MVDAAGVGGGRRPGEGEVPFEEVRIERRRVEGRIRVGGELGRFFEDAFDGGRFGVECWEGHGVGMGGTYPSR